MNFRHPFGPRGCLKIRLGNFVILVYENCMKFLCTIIMYKTKSFREKLVRAIDSKFLIFMFVDQLLLVDLFSQLYYLSHAKKQQWRTSVINR